MTSAEDAFRPAFEEINRRASLVRDGEGCAVDETTHFTRDSEPHNLPYKLVGQNFALVTMGTCVLAPRPLDQLRPALRVYGAFASRDEAKEHATIVSALDNTCSMVVVPLREWFILPQTEACRDDLEARKRRIERRLQQWRVCQMEEGDKFKRRMDEHLQPEEMSAVGDSETARRREEEEDGTTEAEGLLYRPPRRLRSGGEVRGQSYVGLSVIPDDVVGECLVMLHGFHETSQDTDRWCRNVASRAVTDDDIYVASTCEWLYPNGETTDTTHHYRHPELQRIMDASDRNVQGVQDYNAWKAEQDRLAAEEEKEE